MRVFQNVPRVARVNSLKRCMVSSHESAATWGSGIMFVIREVRGLF